MKRINKKGGALNHNLRCAANVEYTDGSCLSVDQLKLIAHLYNKAIDKNKIKSEKINIDNNNKSYLLQQLDEKLKDCNNDQRCWLKKKFNHSNEAINMDEVFRPMGTEGKTEWLSTENIDDVMEQMEKKFPNYLFLGATPMDFQEINYNEIAKLDFDDIMKNGEKLKNLMMVQYELKKFYTKNFKLVEKFNQSGGRQNRYPFREFYKDIIETQNNQMQEAVEKFINNQMQTSLQQFTNVSNLYNELLEIKNKKYPIKTIGLVPNLDNHDQGGSHWVAVYANLETGQIHYFDSYGIRPEKRIREFVKRIAEWKYKKDTGKVVDIPADDYMKKEGPLNELEKKYDIRYNQIRNQYKNSECGVYSMNFIIRLLHGTTFDKIISQKVPDDTINECREVYFNNQNITLENYAIEDDGKRIKIKRTPGYICE